MKGEIVMAVQKEGGKRIPVSLPVTGISLREGKLFFAGTRRLDYDVHLPEGHQTIELYGEDGVLVAHIPTNFEGHDIRNGGYLTVLVPMALVVVEYGGPR